MNDELNRMTHPIVIRPEDYAEFRPEKMGKATLFESSRLLVGLNGFEPGQSHALHTHAGMDKMYQVISGSGVFLLEDRELPMAAGDVLIAPEGIPTELKIPGPDASSCWPFWPRRRSRFSRAKLK